MIRPNALCLCFAVAVVLVWGTAGYSGMISHWSFDANTLSTDGGGNITGAAEETGSHNASLGSGVGSATVAQGGPTFNSNTIPGTNSVTGQFGEALTLTGSNTAASGGGQFLMFPNLTELMQSGGAPSYTVSLWLKTTTTNTQSFTVLSDWGNSATNPGRFAYGWGFQFTSGNPQMRGQTRTSGATSGTDIYSRAPTTAGLNNGTWHMLTWTFDSTAGQLKSYFDANLVETFNSSQANGFKMWNSSSSVGTFGFKGDSGNFINGTYTLDEVWVMNHLMSADEVQRLYQFNVIPEPASIVLAFVGAITGFAIVDSRMRKQGNKPRKAAHTESLSKCCGKRIAAGIHA